MNPISTDENLLFLAFCADTCNDIEIISIGNSSIYFTDRIDSRRDTIMMGLHKTDTGRYFFRRYIHSDKTDMETLDMFVLKQTHETKKFNDMKQAIEAYSSYRFNVL